MRADAAEVITAKLFCSRDPEFVFYDQLKQTMNAYRFVLMRGMAQRPGDEVVHAVLTVQTRPILTLGIFYFVSHLGFFFFFTETYVREIKILLRQQDERRREVSVSCFWLPLS